jgi:hypothetical protein
VADKLLILVDISKKIKNALRKPNLTLRNKVPDIGLSVSLHLLQALEKSFLF